MRFARVTRILIVLVISMLVSPEVTQAGIPFFGPIIPDAVNRCAAGWGGVMLVINNVISFALTLLIVFIAPLTIAYAGFLYVVNPMNPSGRSKANGILWNTVIGLVVALSAWIMVDALMAVLYRPDNPGAVWSQLIGSGGQNFCLIQSSALENLDQAKPSQGVTGVTPTGRGVYVDGKSAALCAGDSKVCSPAVLQAAGFTPTQAKVMSCIAMTENSGNAIGCNGNACGTFQIMLTVNPLVGPACAKYNNNNPRLNCPALCKAKDGGAVRNEPSCQPCKQAAEDAACNAQAAHNLFTQSGYGPWTTSSDNTKSAACIQQHGNS